MRKAFPRALFFDLDGTLLAPGSVLTRRTTEAVRRAADRGTEVVLATGGFSHRARQLARTLDGNGPARVWAVTHNGAAIWQPGGDLVFRLPMPTPAMRVILEHAGSGVWLAYEAVGADGNTEMYYAGRQRPEMYAFVWGPLEDAIGGAERGVWRPARGGARRGEDVLGCWCVGTPEALQPLDALAADGRLGGARYHTWSSRLSQILGRPRMRLVGRDVGHSEASKGAAAQWLCQRLGISPLETAAFGDANNDLDMLGFAGTAVAMPHASKEVLACADLIAPSHEQDGVAQVLEAWLDLRNSTTG